MYNDIITMMIRRVAFVNISISFSSSHSFSQERTELKSIALSIVIVIARLLQAASSTIHIIINNIDRLHT